MTRQNVASLLNKGARLGIFNLKGECKAGKILVRHEGVPLRPGSMVWDIGPEHWPIEPGASVFISLHVVVWAKPWTSFDSARKSLVRFRPATEEEFALETVMNE